MNREFKTTFIPKKKLAVNRTGKPRLSKGKSSMLSLLAGLLFITAIISVGGVYAYKMRVQSVVNSQITSINRAEKAFEPTLILELKKLDIRLKAGTNLLNNHVALSDFFKSFGESTLPEVTFKDFTYAYGESGGEVKLSGEARNYVSIAQQSDVFEKNQYIKNHIFSDFSKTDTNYISFNLTFTLDSELSKYGRKVKNIQSKAKVDKDAIINNSARGRVPQGQKVDFSDLSPVKQ